MTYTGVGILVRHALEFREGKVGRGPREVVQPRDLSEVDGEDGIITVKN
jgi:hypothetical protein